MRDSPQIKCCRLMNVEIRGIEWISRVSENTERGKDSCGGQQKNLETTC